MNVVQFGQSIKKKYPQYKDYSDEDIGSRMLKKYPQYSTVVTADKASSDLGGKFGSFIDFINPISANLKGGTKAFNEITQKQSKLQTPRPGDLVGAVKNAGAKTGIAASAIGKNIIANPNILAENALNAMGLTYGKAAGKVSAEVGKAVVNPKRAIGKRVEQLAAKGGNASEELLKKRLGTIREPARELWESAGLQSGKAKELAQRALKDFYANSADDTLEGFGKVFNSPSFKDILKNRTGAYKTASKGFFEPSTIEKAVAKNFARAYTDILHEGVKGTKKYDKVLSLLHQLNSPYIKLGAGGALVNYFGSRLLKGSNISNNILNAE